MIEETVNVVSIPLVDIDADDDFNCRGVISPIDVASLAKNIEEQGLISSGTVIIHPEGVKKYKLIAGFRRYLALKMLGKTLYPCNIKENMNHNDAMFFNLNENIQRKELTIMQEARALKRIKEIDPKLSRDDCANKLGMSPGWVQVREQLLRLPEEIQLEVEAGVIKQTQIRELNSIMRFEGKERCFEVAKQLKDALARGVKPRIKKKMDREKKTQRKRAEIFDMLEDINERIPYTTGGLPPLWSKCLAWCAGEISDRELFAVCHTYCAHFNLIWTEPENVEGIQVCEER